VGITISTKMIYFFGETPIDGVSHLPLLSTNFINPNIKKLSDYDFLIVTSKRSIQALIYFSYEFNDIELYCVGEKTATFAKDKGLNVKHISKGYAKDLISDVKEVIKAKKGLYIRPKDVANEYITSYVKTGLLEEAICYETVCSKIVDTKIIQPAVLLFAAPSQVACFKKYFTFDKDDLAVVIGQTTADSLDNNVKYIISDNASLDSLKSSAIRYLEKNKSF
jgi:uroporphyrinogen-III synthase